MKRRKYFCRRCFYFLIDPNILDKEVGQCYYLTKTTKTGKDKACKHYRPRPSDNN